MAEERPVFFDCAGDQLLGILHQPFIAAGDIGVLLLVGGPQYRVGSHRQFVLLARDLAAAGIPVFRFDYRGMGDSDGVARDFEQVADDIRAALDCYAANSAGLQRVVLWGLCDAASANAFYAATDERVVGQIALNPWVRTLEGEAQAFIKHYYLQRVLSRAFWRKVLTMQFDATAALGDFIRKLAHTRRGDGFTRPARDERALPVRLRDAQIGFSGATLVILSGQDLTAREYELRVAESAAWQRWMGSGRVTVQRLEEADHTFSRALWRDQVAAWSRDWIERLPK